MMGVEEYGADCIVFQQGDVNCFDFSGDCVFNGINMYFDPPSGTSLPDEEATVKIVASAG
jgi:hypothetical protein